MNLVVENINLTGAYMFFLDMLDLLDFSGVNRSTNGIFDKRVFPDYLILRCLFG